MSEVKLASMARVAASSRVERSVLWEGAVVERGAQVRGSILTAGAVVLDGERATNVIVLPSGTEGLEGRADIERHGDMAWVAIE